ncbi:DUF2306 domain-containing protein [Oryzibacter oryziterrae]|uniref:DUF2306 domain-containing protein n=1 Tax=Oryzibacter oryziterrae TaxID=2766474 RepID=UPI0028BF12CE|nr:DUF2306 domain-containing protein [Oryzibacter oryziterrae]
MHIAPLLNAPLQIEWHAIAALVALGLGIFQLAGPKGRTAHRVVGWLWVLLMLSVAISSLFIHEIRLIGPFSPIHLLSILTIVSVPLAVLHARRHDISRHRRQMQILFYIALIGAGLFTLLPGRLMGEVVFGFPSSLSQAAGSATIAADAPDCCKTTAPQP